MNKTWKTIKKGDYLYAKVKDHPRATKNGYVLEHRIVVEKSLGRYLLPTEVVHHKDEDKHNNCISNLQVMSSSEHATLHNKKGRTFLEFTCPVCGKAFLKEKRQVKPNVKFPKCSRRCNGLSSKNLGRGSRF